MVGQGVLRECLLDPGVECVKIVGRTASRVQHPKLKEVIHQDLLDFSSLEGELSGFDASFFCLGVSSAGMTESDYQRVTYGITMAAAQTLSRLNQEMTFIYVSGLAPTVLNRSGPCWRGSKAKPKTRCCVYTSRPLYVSAWHY